MKTTGCDYCEKKRFESNCNCNACWVQETWESCVRRGIRAIHVVDWVRACSARLRMARSRSQFTVDSGQFTCGHARCRPGSRRRRRRPARRASAPTGCCRAPPYASRDTSARRPRSTRRTASCANERKCAAISIWSFGLRRITRIA